MSRRAVPAQQRTRHPTEVRRRQVVRAALELMTERGVAGISARDIARKAGVSPGTVSYHFSGVQEILAEAITVEVEEYYAPLMAEVRLRTPTEALHGLVDALFTAETERHWRRWFDYWRLGSGSDDFAERQAQRYTEWHAQIRAIIASGRETGEFRRGDPGEVAVRFVALVDGLALQWLRGAPPVSAEQAREHLHRFVVDELTS